MILFKYLLTCICICSLTVALHTVIDELLSESMLLVFSLENRLSSRLVPGSSLAVVNMSLELCICIDLKTRHRSRFIGPNGCLYLFLCVSVFVFCLSVFVFLLENTG